MNRCLWHWLQLAEEQHSNFMWIVLKAKNIQYIYKEKQKQQKEEYS